MSAGRSANDPTSPRLADKEPDIRSSAKNESQQLLDEVLQATLQLSSPDEPLQPDELRKLVALARRRKTEPLSIETVAELVEMVLRLRFRRVVESSALWDRMTRQIATTIFEDPQAQKRMRSLWAQLCGDSP